MKVVLREPVDHLGERGDVVAVAAGYARNYLLPKRLALEATAANLKFVAHQRKVWDARETRDIGEAEALARRLGELELKIVKRAGDSGTLYGSVTSMEIAELLAARGVTIDRRKIVLADPIKALGTYEVTLRLHRTVNARVRLDVHDETDPKPR